MCVQEEGGCLLNKGKMRCWSLRRNTRIKEGIRARTKLIRRGKNKVPPQDNIKKESKCFFCKKKGHMKKDCTKFKKWLENKGNSISCVCYESNMVDVNHNTWWIDSGSTIHISNTL